MAVPSGWAAPLPSWQPPHAPPVVTGLPRWECSGANTGLLATGPGPPGRQPQALDYTFCALRPWGHSSPTYLRIASLVVRGTRAPSTETRSLVLWAGTHDSCSCSAPFDRIAEINFHIDADEDSVSGLNSGLSGAQKMEWDGQSVLIKGAVLTVGSVLMGDHPRNSALFFSVAQCCSLRGLLW